MKPRPTAVIDSSALINFVHLDLVQNLHLYFQTIYVPKTVQAEVNRKGRFRYRLNKLYKRRVFSRCQAGNALNVRLLMPPLHPGEAEALVQASEIGATVFIGDEPPARKMSERRNLRPVGTARILARLCLEGYADSPRRLLVQRLREEVNFQIAEEVIDEALQKAHEPI
jgi:predicted nucleic acid-binding protein